MTFEEWKAEPYSRTFEDAWKAGAASRDAEVAELKKLLTLIFESTHPYRDDGACTFADSVTDKWKELMP